MPQRFQRYLWTNLGIILGSFLVFGAIFYFLSQSLGGEVDKITANRTAIAQRSTDLESLSKLKTDTAAATELQKKIDALLPSQDSLIGFPQFLNTLARNHSLSSVFNFDGSPVPPAAQAPGYVDFTATVEGDPANIRGLIDELENKTTKFMVNLREFVFIPIGSAYRADLKGRVFFQDNQITPP